MKYMIHIHQISFIEISVIHAGSPLDKLSGLLDMLYVWENVHVKESDVKLDPFIGYLKFKYKECPIQLKNLQIFM